MDSDHKYRRRNVVPGVIITMVLALMSASLGAQVLELEEAETLALASDPSVHSVRSRQAALGELEVAAAQLPDPMVKMGFMSLPTDSFQLGQEPMTQVQLGVVQKFPRGDSRELRAEQLRERARGLDEVAQDLQLKIVLSVREEFIEVVKHQRLAEINREAEAVFSDLEQITQEYYATGRVQQQDVLRAAVELSKVHERSSRIAEDEDRARARLAAWIGEAAWRPLETSWPKLPGALPPDAAKQALQAHPRLRALHQQVVAADRGVALAEQSYKPEFSVDLTYGGRGGDNPDGSSRSDLLTMMVMMDVPLFREKRQDRVVAASMAESSAAAFERDDVHRRMLSEFEMHHSTLLRQRERLALFEDSLLEDAKFNAESTFQAYQAALEDLTTLMRASITEFDLQLDYQRLKAESQKTLARLLYLQGAES
jgi:outer membrane protein TolC